jgi:hypothetical protein
MGARSVKLTPSCTARISVDLGGSAYRLVHPANGASRGRVNGHAQDCGVRNTARLIDLLVQDR